MKPRATDDLNGRNTMRWMAIPVFGLAITCGVIGYLNHLEIELIDCSKVIDDQQKYNECLKGVENIKLGVIVSIVFVVVWSVLGILVLTLKDEANQTTVQKDRKL